MKKRIVAAMLAMCMTLGLVACGQGASNDEAPAADASGAAVATSSDVEVSGEAVYGGTLNVCNSIFFGVFDPAAPLNQNYTGYVYDCLFNVDLNSDYTYATDYRTQEMMKCNLAESYTVADDYSYIEVKIREGVHFQDKSAVGMAEYDIYGGRELTAEDVKFSYDRMIGIDGAEAVQIMGANWTSSLGMVESIDVIDNYTVRFNFNTKNEVAVNNFIITQAYICGPEFGELTEEQQADWHYMTGTGAFILKNYVSDNYMEFVKNDNYWATDDRPGYEGNKLPYLDGVTLTCIMDSSNGLSQFISGDLDLVSIGYEFFDKSQNKQIADNMDADSYYKFQRVTSSKGIAIKQGVIPALDDQRVREAMQYALDLESITADYLGFDTTDICGLWGFGSDYYSPEAWGEGVYDSYVTYDPEKAKALLEEAGYADGFEFDCMISPMADPDLFAIVAQYLSEVGITMNVVPAATNDDERAAGMSETDPTICDANCGFYALEMIKAFVEDGSFLNYVHQKDDVVAGNLEKMVNATSVDEQKEAAIALDASYMQKHYLLEVSYGNEYYDYASARIGGVSNVAYTNADGGYVMARYWAKDGK